MDILAEIKPKTIQLADGKDYSLPPINMTTLANLEETVGYGLNQMQERMQGKTISTMRDILFALLNVNYPDLTIEQVGELVPMSRIKDVVDIIGSVFEGV